MWSSDTLQKLDGYDFILGSASPRRAEILRTNLGIQNYTIVTSSFEENLPRDNITDVEYVTTTAQHKLPSIVAQLDQQKEYVLLAADTVVSCGGKVFEKPGTPENQWSMLLYYRAHSSEIRVITAVHACRVSGGQILRHEYGHEITTLNFDVSISDEQLQNYIATGEGSHVAGGFKYQERGSMLFDGINGDYFNVVGLPVKLTHGLLSKIL